MTTVYCHIGTHKTGTTSIQHALRRGLRREGERGAGFLNLPLRHTRAFMATDSYDEALVTKQRALLDAGIQALMSDGPLPQNLVISWEGFSGRASQGYRNSATAAAMLRSVLQDFDVRIVVYLRRQDDFAESMYTQTIHEGSSQTFPTFFAQFNEQGFLDYDRFLADFEQRFGTDNILVRSYGHASGKGLLQDFEDATGVTFMDAAGNEAPQNRSYSRAALEIARVTNGHLSNRQCKQLRKILQKQLPKPVGSAFEFLSMTERQAYLEQCAASNQAVADRYFSGDVRALFAPPQEPDPAGSDISLSIEQIASVIVPAMQLHDSSRGNQDRNRRIVPRILKAGLNRFPQAKQLVKRALAAG